MEPGLVERRAVVLGASVGSVPPSPSHSLQKVRR
jgi:hypothetical protein